MPRKTAEQQLAELEAKEAQLKARIQDVRSQVKAKERKQDTRRKIIAGALALEHADTDPEWSSKLNRLLSRYVKRAEDRALFGLDPLPPEREDAPASS